MSDVSLFFFSSRRRHTRWPRDWSSDVCSSDLFAKILRVIPISSQQRPREMIHSLREAAQVLRDGELVCIFPEGQMTRIGQMLPRSEERRVGKECRTRRSEYQ